MPSPRPLAALFVPLLALFAGAGSARAATVSGLHAEHRHGQTFLVWTSPPGTGWKFRIHRSTAPIVDGPSLDAATLVGSVGDSTWADRRLSSIRGQWFAHSIDSLAAPLSSSQGLCVITPAADRTSWYAVTAQQGAGAEDRTVVPGANALTQAVVESLALPRPVYQRTLTSGAITFDVYTTWANPEDTPLHGATATGHGFAFDHAVVRGAGGGPLHMRLHARGGHFLTVLGGTTEPGEWRVALDDHLFDSEDGNSFWYGFHEDYDLAMPQSPVPVAGQVRAYTLRRILHTFAWARRELPVDTARVVASGGSMGAIGSLRLAFAVPHWLAAVHLIVPKFDFSFTSDPNPANLWNADGRERPVGDRLWGTVAGNLPCDEGLPVYDRLNDAVLAGPAGAPPPPMIAYCGRNDVVVGWAEKIGFFESMQAHRRGGTFYWDNRQHNGTGAVWGPSVSVRSLYRYRTDRSFPALSNADCDDDPGDGSLASGDTLGTLNGHLDWDVSLTDEPGGWGCTLSMRDLASTSGTVVAPESALVDVTPRRLQRFAPLAGESFTWQVHRVADGALLQSGAVQADAGGLVTVPAVRVLRAGVRLSIARPEALGVGGTPEAPAAPALRALRNPARGAVDLLLAAPAGTLVSAELFDLGGRRVRQMPAFRTVADETRLRWPAAGLAPGVYLARARAGGRSAVIRLTILPQ